MEETRISLGFRPRGCRRVRILGVRPNLADYEPEARALIQGADKVLYPTRLYAQSLTDAGKTVFPSARDYHYLGDKSRQYRLFEALGLATPLTRIYYGRQAEAAPAFFGYPFVAKLPRGAGEGRGVYLISSETQWWWYLSRTREAYVQEYLPLERDLRVVAVAGRLVTAYWRLAPPGGFKTNLFQGGRLDFSGLPAEGLAFALEVIKKCGFDDVGLDVCRHGGRWLVLEANMHYGLEGFRAAGLSLAGVLDRLIEEGVV
ncbi:MAG: RimK family alpha-L-glutamate ligase [Thermodesulfobacteriota bacterium]